MKEQIAKYHIVTHITGYSICQVCTTYQQTQHKILHFSRVLLAFACTYYILGSKSSSNSILNFMFKLSHKKSYLVCVEFPNFRILCNIYLFASSCPWHVGCLNSQFCTLKKNYYVIFRKFETYQIAFLMTCQRQK